MLKVGDRVRVQLVNAEREWHRGAAASLEGALGVVEELPREPTPTSPRPEQTYLVRFDAPQEPWHSNQLPVTAFHFWETDLVRVGRAP